MTKAPTNRRALRLPLSGGRRVGDPTGGAFILRPTNLLLAAAAIALLPLHEAHSKVLTPRTSALSADHVTPLVRVQASDPQRTYIMDIQRHLQTLGLYRSAIDGVAGPGTWRAIEQFYRMAGITGDRRFGDDELALLGRAVDLYRAGGLTPSDAVRRAVTQGPDADMAHQRGVEAWRAGRYSKAEGHFRLAYAEYSRLHGPEHPDTLASRGWLANVIYAQGRHAEAEALHRETLVTRERVLGSDHPSTLNSRNSLAVAIRDQGRYDEAEALHRETLAGSERVLGEDHPDTLTSRTNLAAAIYSQGRFAEAESLHRETLATRERLLGLDHTDTLTSRSYLANAIEAQGRFAEAESLHRETLAGFEHVLGPEHPSTLTMRSHLANAIRAQGRFAEGEALHRETLAGSERVLGQDHPHTLASRHNLAAATREQGRYAEAEALHRENLASVERVFGPEHPNTLASRGNLAAAIDAQGRYAEAEALYRETLAIQVRVLGPEHPETLTMRHNLASTILAQGHHAKAEALDRGTLASRERVLGPEHPNTLNSRNSLAATIGNQGRNEDALTTIEDGFLHLPSSYATNGRISLNLPHYLEWAWTAAEVSIAELAARTFPAQGYLTYGDIDVALGDTAARREVGDPVAAEVLREFQDAREDVQRLRRVYLASFEAESGVTEVARAQIQSDMRAADARFSEIAARIDSDFPALAELELPRALSAEEAQALLEPGEGLLAYVSSEDYLYAWLATRDEIVWHRIDAPRAALAERVSHLRASLDLSADAPAAPPLAGCALVSSSLPDRPFDLCAAHELHEIVLGEIDLSGIVELIVVPDGPLESLPFAMLVTDYEPDRSPRWLVEDHAITTLPTTSSLRALRQHGDAAGDDDRLPFLGIAPVEFDATSPDSVLRGAPLVGLPGTADEVRLLSALLGAGREGSVIGSDASEAFVKSAPLDRYRVLSFATHGLLSREAADVTAGTIREMALALRSGDGEDGFLTASEVAGLRLDADWVLLSACNTAGGDGDDAQGLSGLARAFFFAGARTLMVSHWLIDDAVTPALMADTMQRSGAGTEVAVSRAQALRQAQLAMLSQRDTEHPFYWAPFSVVGENR